MVYILSYGKFKDARDDSLLLAERLDNGLVAFYVEGVDSDESPECQLDSEQVQNLIKFLQDGLNAASK